MASMVVISEDAEYQTWAELVSYIRHYLICSWANVINAGQERARCFPNVFHWESGYDSSMSCYVWLCLIQSSAEIMQELRLLSIISQYF